MKFLKRIWVNVPDQVLSTALLFFLAYVPIRGIVAIFKDPPTINTIIIVMCIGIALGIFVSIPNEEQIQKAKDEMGMDKDKENR